MGFFDNLFGKKETKESEIRSILNDSVDPIFKKGLEMVSKGQKLDDETRAAVLAAIKKNPQIYRELWTKMHGGTKFSTKEEQEKWLGSKENLTKETLLEELDFVENQYKNNSFYVVKEILVDGIKHQHKEIIEILKKSDRGVREFMHSTIGNQTGDLLETGKYHVYRGVLGIVGQDLLKIFDKSYDFLVQMKAKDIDEEYANRQKEVLRNNIKNVG